jgi:creatinine amidohydrolase
VLAERPELVHPDRMEGLEEHHVDMPAAIAAGQTDFLAMGMEQAYCGAPAEASADEGQGTFDTLTDMLVELIREVAP